MPSFQSHFDGHSASLLQALKGQHIRDHFRREFKAAFDNLNVPTDKSGPAISAMMDALEKVMPARVPDHKAEATTKAVMQIFADTVAAASKAAA